MKKIKYFVTFEAYMNGTGSVKIYTCTSFKNLLKLVIEKHCYGLDEDDPIEMTEKELLERLDSQNGDGCDFILSIISSEGKLVYKCNE